MGVILGGGLGYVLFTSGTTGLPKGVVTTHEQNLRAIAAWSACVGLNADDRYLIVNPFFHSFGYKVGWLAGLIAGLTVLRSEEHTSELQSLMRISYAVFCLKKKTDLTNSNETHHMTHKYTL